MNSLIFGGRKLLKLLWMTNESDVKLVFDLALKQQFAAILYSMYTNNVCTMSNANMFIMTQIKVVELNLTISICLGDGAKQKTRGKFIHLQSFIVIDSMVIQIIQRSQNFTYYYC